MKLCRQNITLPIRAKNGHVEVEEIVHVFLAKLANIQMRFGAVRRRGLNQRANVGRLVQCGFVAELFQCLHGFGHISIVGTGWIVNNATFVAKL